MSQNSVPARSGITTFARLIDVGAQIDVDAEALDNRIICQAAVFAENKYTIQCLAYERQLRSLCPSWPDTRAGTLMICMPTITLR